jgi:hypothetical protein
MRALAGPAMLLVIVGGFLAVRYTSRDEGPSRQFTGLEFADSCYSLDTVLVTNRFFNGSSRTWTSPRDDAWTLKLDDVVAGPGGPVRVYQKFTFEKYGDQVRLVSVEASKGMNTDLVHNIDELLEEPNGLRSTPIDRCKAPGASGYHFAPKR